MIGKHMNVRRAIVYGVFLWLQLMPAAPVGARSFYAAVNGRKDAAGTLRSPMELHSLIYGLTPVGPGDTVYIRGGIYNDSFHFHWAGNYYSPVVIRSFPGETAVLRGNVGLRPGSCYITFMDFEITTDVKEHPQRVTQQRGSSVKDIYTCEGLTIGLTWMHGIRVINLVIHDNIGDGMSMWTRATNSEIYGNIIYNNGWDGPDRGHGHGIYTQNDTGMKIIEDNICFGNMGSCGIKLYSETGSVKNYYLEGNIILNLNWFLIGGLQPLSNIQLINNYLGDSAWINLGYYSKPNHNLVAKGNYLQKTMVKDWQNMVFESNKIIGRFEIWPKDSTSDTGYHIDHNIYFPGSELYFRKRKTSLKGLQDSGFEQKGVQLTDWPSSPDVIVRPNKYEKGRANIIVYNWDKRDSVTVDLGNVLRAGDVFEVKDVQHYSGKPVWKGVFRNQPLHLPMNLSEADPLLGDVSTAHHPRYMPRKHSAATFGTFVVRKVNRTD